MDRIAELLARLMAFVGLADDEQPPADVEPLTDEELAELDDTIRAEADNDELTLEELTALADGAEAVRGEQANREQAATEEAERRAEQVARIAGPAEEEPEAEEPPAAETVEEAEPSAAEPAGEPPAEEEPAEPEAVAAAAPRPRVPASLRPRPRPVPPGEVIVAAGEIPGHSAGAAIADIGALGRAFTDKADMLARGQKARVATFRQPAMPEARTLREGDTAGNTRKLQAMVAAAMQGEEALAAAGGRCGPATPSYSQQVVETARRPLRDSLVRFDAARGAYTFTPPPTMADTEAGVGIWTQELDADPGAATKPCVTITCDDDTTVDVDAVLACARIGNFSRRSFPERFAAWWEKMRAYHARVAENKLWDTMCSDSTAVTAGAINDATQILGAARDILVELSRAAAALRYRHRTAMDQTLDVWLPEFTRDLMLADFTRQLPGDNAVNLALSEIEGYLRDRNLNVTWSPDAGGQGFGVEAGDALQGWPSSVDAIMSFPGSFVFLDAGTLDLGTEIRDSDLIETNDVMGFTETFENVAFVGVESYCISMNVCPSGATAATEDTSALCTTTS